MTDQSNDDDDATRVQPLAVREFNEQLGRAYMLPNQSAVSDDTISVGETYTIYGGKAMSAAVPPPPTVEPRTPPTRGSSTPGTPLPLPATPESPPDIRGIPLPGGPRRAHHEQLLPEPEPKRFGWVALILTALACAAVGALLVSLIAAHPIIESPLIRAVTPQSCINALRAADKIIETTTGETDPNRQGLETEFDNYRQQRAYCQASR